MHQSGEVLKQFYAEVAQKNLANARKWLDEDLIFYGLFETYHSAKSYITALTGLPSVTSNIDVRTIIAEGDQAAIFSTWRPLRRLPARHWSLSGASDERRQNSSRQIGVRWPLVCEDVQLRAKSHVPPMHWHRRFISFERYFRRRPCGGSLPRAPQVSTEIDCIAANAPM